MRPEDRIVITGIGLTAPNGNSLKEFRKSLLEGRSGVTRFETRFMGEVLAGVCDFDELKYQKKKSLRRGTRAGSIAIYCSQEAVSDSGIAFDAADKSRVGVYLGTTEHGNVETENEVHAISKYDYDTKYWSHHHNPRTVANNPAGEVTLNMGITGPHYAIGAACAAGNLGIIQGAQMLRLNEVDLAFAGGVSESIRTFGIFASFKSEGALAEHTEPTKASRPFDKNRNGIVCSEGGCVYTLERLPDAEARGAKIYGEIIGHASNSDAFDYILPEPGRQAECMQLALDRAGLKPEDIDILNTHATATQLGDIQESKAVRTVFGMEGRTRINNTKSYMGHTMGAAGALELTGNLPAFEDGYVHPTINLDEIDPECRLNNLVANTPELLDNVNIIMNNSFGMFGINSVLIVRKYQK
jgi:3-oxoacyl-[acyl-carrier-protein] synthase II